MASPSTAQSEVRAVSSFERDALCVLTLANRPMDRAEWARLLQHTGVESDGEPVSVSDLGAFTRRLEREHRIVATKTTYSLAYTTHPKCLLESLADAERAGRLERLHSDVQKALGYSSRESWRYAHGSGLLMRFGTELRVALTVAEEKRAQTAIELVDNAIGSSRAGRVQLAEWLVDMLGPAPSEAWLDMIGQYAGVYLEVLARNAWQLLVPLDPRMVERAEASKQARHELARYYAVRGDRARVAALASAKTTTELGLLVAFFQGDRALALACGKEAVAQMPKSRKHRQLRELEGLCHALARVEMSHRDAAEWDALGPSADNAKVAKAGYPTAYGVLALFVRAARSGQPLDRSGLASACGYYSGAWWHAPWPTVLTAGLVHAWAESREEWVTDPVEAWSERAREAGFERLALELDGVLAALRGEEPAPGTLATAYRAREPWEIALDTLEQIALDGPSSAVEAAIEKHVVWEVDLSEHAAEVQARIAGGRARRGKAVSISRLLDGREKCVSERDRRVLSLVEFEQAWNKSKKPVLRTRALLGLVDHPYVRRPDGAQLSISRGQPGLKVESVGEALHVRLEPASLVHSEIAFEEQTHAHVVVYERTPELQRLAQALGTRGTLELPGHARDRLGKVLAGLGSTVRVFASADIEVAGQEQPPDSRVVVVLRWDGITLHARLRIAPLGLDGPHVKPGEGGGTVAANLDGNPIHTTRDFDAERANVDALLDACPLYGDLPQQHGEARASELTDAMDVLIELDAMGDAITLAWPRGARLSTPVVRGLEHLRVGVRESNDWLTVDAQLPVDENTVLGFRELLERRQGRFVKLGDSRFVALTEELKRRLDQFDGLGKVQKAGLVTSPVVLPLVEELTRGAGHVALDPESEARLERVERAGKLNPEVPRAFEAELRDYQREGFVWLVRLAEAGLGACLADDMGLGKTIQTLAVLVLRATNGPALVVAPTSVASNWIDEATRFAPSLRFVPLRTGDREAIVEGLGPRDVLVCSYGLLVTEAERLTAVSFDTVVFDEAHMLKNARTKRARAAAALKAGFRLSLTGTPIENHLGELWSLMQVTVPGLLGTEKRFENRFAGPIRAGDRERQRQVRALLRPFLLRRTKAQVLDELPPRTEVTLRVTPTDAEGAFYEALRRRALEELEGAKGSKGRIQVLAQIMKLRQAAVDPRLIEDGGPQGAKVDALMEKVRALREEGHRVLVFSQFLGGMQLVREGLEAAEISYLDLDGSTPAKERGRRIAAFQDGEADVFVMSLKAGGVGVNLTGADYVIHLDPWWNPAVEDQATGRAHRIGQERPVTVYRLVTAGTIEEKILSLHRDKRELAEDLLENMSRAKKLDVAELRQLL